MPRRIDLGRAVLVVGSALLLISLFTRWYDTGPTGWEVFESLDLVLAAIAVGGVVAALRPDTVPPWAGWALPGAAFVIVLVQILNAPPAAGDGSASTGAWLALAASVLMGAGSALSLTAISVTVHVGERDVRRRVPAVDRRAEREAEAAEGLDSDAGAEPSSDPAGSSATRGGRLGARFGTARAAADPSPATPLAGTSRVDPSHGPPATGRSGSEGGRAAPAPSAGGAGASSAREAPATPSAAARRSEVDDLERTQPMTGLSDKDADADPDDAQRP